MSDPRTPEEDTIDTGDAPEQDPPLELPDEPYHGPDPEADEKATGRTRIRAPNHRRCWHRLLSFSPQAVIALQMDELQRVLERHVPELSRPHFGLARALVAR